MAESHPDLTISIICSDNLNLLLPCLRSVFEATHQIVLEVFVVDNASSDDTAEAVQVEFPHATVIRNATPMGFSYNNNQVLRQGRGRYLMLLNDDTVVLEGALDVLVGFMDMHPEVGAAGSHLLNSDRTPQPAFAGFPHPVVEAFLPATTWASRRAIPKREPFAVDTVCGAAMLVRREVVHQVGLLDTAFDPVYSEEVDWCFRIKRRGWEVFSVPESKIIHYGGVTMNRAVPRKYQLLLSHKTLFFRKHMGKTAANIFRASLGLSTVVKLVWWGGRSLLDGRYRERCDLHWGLLKRIPRW